VVGRDADGVIAWEDCGVHGHNLVSISIGDK
jgi:hypothetical protein